MKGKSKLYLSLFLSVCMVVLMATCSLAATGDKLKIGFSNGFSGNIWRAMMLASLNQEVAKYDDVELIVVDGQNDVNKQVSDIESLIAMDVDGIMVIPNSAQAIEPALIRAKEAGIKVCVFNLPVEDPESYDVFLGTNMAKKGEGIAKWLVEKLGGKGNVVMLGGIPGNSATAIMADEFYKAIKGTEINVLVYKDADWSEDKAKMIMADLLIAYDKIDGIWADGGGVACGAGKAMLEAGRGLVPTTGDDYNGLFKLYLDNKAKYPNYDIGTISEPTWESRDAFRQLYKLLKGEQVERDTYIVPDLITGVHADKFVQPDMPDSLFVDNDIPKEILEALVK